MTNIKYALKDVAGNYPQKRGRKSLPIVVKCRKKQIQVSKVCIGHVDPSNGAVCYNEMIQHPTVKRLMKNGKATD